MIVVVSRSTTTRSARPSCQSWMLSSVRPSSCVTCDAAGEDRQVLVHRAVAAAPYSGVGTATDVTSPRSLLTTSVASASPAMCSPRSSSGLPVGISWSSSGRTSSALLSRSPEIGDVGVLEHGLHALGVGDHVRRDVAPAEAHALDQLQLEPGAVVRLDVDDAVLARPRRTRSPITLAELRVVGRDRRDADHLLPVGDLPRLHVAQVRDDLLDGALDPAAERDRVGARGRRS